MRIEIKIVTNSDELKKNDYERQIAVAHNVQNPYAKIEVPRKVYPRFKTTNMGIRQCDILDFWVDPLSKEKDIRINLATRGEIAAVYNPILESKLEQIFQFE